MLQAMGSHWFVIFIKGCAKSVCYSAVLAITTDLSRDRDDVVQMVRESWIVLLLGQLGEVTALSIAHCYLPIFTLHVLVMRLLFKHRPAIDAPENILETVIAWVNTVRAAILDGQSLLQTCNAGRLEELFLLPDDTQLGRTLLTWLFAQRRWVACRWRWWKTYKVDVEFVVPRLLDRNRKADIGQVSHFRVKRMPTCQFW